VSRDTGQLTNIYDLAPDRLAATLAEWGQPSYRAGQVLRWLYRELVTDFSQMTNLPLELRTRLSETFTVGSAQVVAQKISTDGWTRKVLLKMHDGNTVEAVLMLYYDRATACISSQVGCAMGCTFCATGQMGFTRNLTSGEILEQAIFFNRWLRDHPHVPGVGKGGRPRYIAGGGPGATKLHTAHDDAQWFSSGAATGPQREITALTNIVFMGMGEPLVNYNNLWNSIRMLTSPQGLGMSARRLTVSTVGVAPQIRRFARESMPVNLAVSLHSPDDELRSSMMPMNTRYPIADLMDACREYVSLTNRRISFEYVLISGVNDSLDMARRLAALLKGMLCHVNLIPLNPVPGTGMSATSRERVFAFQKIVEDAGISTTVRIERGVDIAAACGQLKVEEEPGSRHRSLNPELVRAHVAGDLASQ
jgi:23S rRNA (adenine2503-C2)-methyltransferase